MLRLIPPRILDESSPIAVVHLPTVSDVSVAVMQLCPSILQLAVERLDHLPPIEHGDIAVENSAVALSYPSQNFVPSGTMVFYNHLNCIMPPCIEKQVLGSAVILDNAAPTEAIQYPDVLGADWMEPFFGLDSGGTNWMEAACDRIKVVAGDFALNTREHWFKVVATSLFEPSVNGMVNSPGCWDPDAGPECSCSVQLDGPYSNPSRAQRQVPLLVMDVHLDHRVMDSVIEELKLSLIHI